MGYIAMQGQDSVMTQDETPEFVVVLGAQVQGGGPLADAKKAAGNKTLEFMQEHPDRTVIVSGGQGPDEADTEASVMARYLIEHGADASGSSRRTRPPTHGKICVFGEACRGGGA